jgi:hypothetical protein
MLQAASGQKVKLPYRTALLHLQTSFRKFLSPHLVCSSCKKPTPCSAGAAAHHALDCCCSPTAGCSLPSWQIDPNHLQQRVASADADAPAHVSSSSNKGTQQSHSNLAQQHSTSPAAADGKWHLASASGQLAQSRTSQEFVRDWKRHCPSAESKYR